MYLTYTIWSNYHNATSVVYCVPNLPQYASIIILLPHFSYYEGSILCILPIQYAPIIILLPHYHNTTKVAYFVPYLHNMIQL